jgi:hypothetical protein
MAHPTTATLTQLSAIVRFMAMRVAAESTLRAAAALAGIPNHYRVQAECAANLAGMRLHRIYGQATPDDAIALRDDLEAIARKIVDPLIAVIGDEAAQNFNGIDLKLFTDQLIGALDGNATTVLSQAAFDLSESRADTIADGRRAFQRAE